MIDVGLSKHDRKLIADALACMLSDIYVLYIKTQGFSWNMRGDGSYALQLLFAEQASDYLHTINKLGQRIRSLDFYVPGSIKEYLHHTGLTEHKTHTQDTHDVIRTLLLDNEFLVRRSHDVYDIANTVNDPVTRHLMQDRMRVHAENAWKLRMHIE